MSKSYKQYSLESGNYRLSKQKQIELVKQYQKNGDNESLELLIKANICYVYMLASKFCHKKEDMDIYVSAGCRGLAKAVKKFKFKLANSFLTYAKWWIEHEIRRETFMYWSVVRVPNHAWEKMRSYQNLVEKNKDITDEELMKKLKVSSEKLQFLKELKPHVSMDEKFGGINSNFSLNKILSDEGKASELLERQSLFDFLMDKMDKFEDKRKIKIIMERFGFFGKPKILKELAKELGISRERVRQLQVESLEELKNEIKCDYKDI